MPNTTPTAPSVIALTGLQARSPLGALAAFGLLRVLSRYREGVRLSWLAPHGHDLASLLHPKTHAAIHFQHDATTKETPKDILVKTLERHADGWCQRVLDLIVDPNERALAVAELAPKPAQPEKQPQTGGQGKKKTGGRGKKKADAAPAPPPPAVVIPGDTKPPDITVSIDLGRSGLQSASALAKPGQREVSDFLAALLLDQPQWEVKKSVTRAEATPFRMMTGSQRFIDRILALVSEHLDSTVPRHAPETVGRIREVRPADICEALFGPWSYSDEGTSMGWDPLRNRNHAYCAIAPTLEGVHTVRVATWLAFEALPLFTMVPQAKRPGVVGWRRVARSNGSHGPRTEQQLVWPIWLHPISINALQSVLTAAPWEQEHPETLRRRGIVAVFAATKGYEAHGKGTLRPPHPLVTT